MKIGLDFDGVIMDTKRLKEAAVRSMYGLDIPGSQLESAYIKANSNSPITLEQYRCLQRKIYVEYAFESEVRFVPEAGRSIRALLDLGYVLHIVTSRDEDAGLGQALQLLSTIGLDIPIHGIGYNLSKADKCKELGLELFVDDDLEKLIPLIGIVPHLYLFNTDDASSFSLPPEIQIVSSWSELIGVIEKLAE